MKLESRWRVSDVIHGKRPLRALDWNKMAVVSLTDLKQMCREPHLDDHISRWQITNAQMGTTCSYHLIKFTLRWMHMAMDYSLTFHGRQIECGGQTRQQRAVWNCLISILNGPLPTCLPHCPSSNPTVHCYVQCDTCCYFPLLKRLRPGPHHPSEAWVHPHHFMGGTNIPQEKNAGKAPSLLQISYPESENNCTAASNDPDHVYICQL